MKRTMLRIGLIGYGGAGRGIHSRLIAQTGGAVAAVVARSAQSQAHVREDWPEAQIFSDVSALVAASNDLDVVVIASPTGLHLDHAMALAQARIPFIADKPLAVSGSDARRIRDAAGDLPYTVFHNRRWDAENRTLHTVLGAGELGRVHTFERRWERWRPVPLERWKESDPIAGGLLLDLGSHLVDSAVQFFGPVTAVQAQIRCLGGSSSDNDVILLAEHASTGVLSRLSASSMVGAPGPRTRVLGDRGAYVTVSCEFEESAFGVVTPGGVAESGGWLIRGDVATPVEDAPGGHADFYRSVYRWLGEGGDVPVDPDDAIHTADVLDAARLSAQSGDRVTVSQ